MALSHRAALVTVGAVATMAVAAFALVIDHLPDFADVSAVEARPAPAQIETGALPRSALYPEAEPRIVEDEEEPSARLEFVPPGALEPSPGLWPSVVASETEDAQSWTTQTEAARAPATKTAAVASNPRIGSPAAVAQSRSRSLQQRLNEISPNATERIAEKFKVAKVAWPPAEIALVAIKDQRSLELYARPASGAWTFVHRYPVLAASGSAGPKLTRGDRQVPEGVYGISYLNPNSRYHVSMRVNYPNSFDRRMAAKDKRRDLGGDIMIHGKKSSAGCLAMGDAAAEELFVMAAEVGVKNIKVVIAPTDFRSAGVPALKPGQPEWLPRLYVEVASELSQFKAPPAEGTGSLLSLLGL